MGLAPPGLAVEHGVLRVIDERERAQVAGGVAVREGDLREAVAVEGLWLREPRAPVEPRPLVALAHLHLVPDEVGHAPDLGRACHAEESVDDLVREEHAPG